ncbi:hypothetical protein B0I35DRAFT_463803, partial [Stachybotrys elegans]
MASLDATREPEGVDLKVEVPGGDISTLASTCASNFYNTLQLLGEEKDEKYEGIFRKFEKRFLDWAAYLGVFAEGNGSLDYRLKSHPQYRDLVLLVLDMLNVSLVQTTTEPSESSADESSDEEVDRRKTETESIRKSINELDRLAIHIRQSSISSLDVRVKAFGARKLSDISFYEARATFAMNSLYPEASDSLRRHLSKSMAQRYTRLLYWQSHDKKLRADRRRDKRRDDPILPPREPSPLPPKVSSIPWQPVRDEDPAPPKPGESRVNAGTSFLSGTRASELGSQFTIPSAEAKMPSRKRAGASSVLETKAKFPSPPKFEDGEEQKPCPLCRKIFLKDDFTDTKCWRSHVNDDLIPFVCVSSTCMGSPTFTGRTAWKEHIGQYHDGMWLQRPKVDSQKSSGTVRATDTCPLCCLPIAEITKLKASIPQASELETSPSKARTPSGNKSASKTVRFDVSEPETLITADTEPSNRAESAMMLNHIADHLQFLALLTPRLSTEKLGEGGTHAFSSDQELSSYQGSGKRSTLDDDFASAEGDKSHDADMDAHLDEAPEPEASIYQAGQEGEEIKLGEETDWSMVATMNPPNEGDDKIEHMRKVRAECDNLLDAALESSVEGRHYRRLFLETAAASCESITTEMLVAVESEVGVGALIDLFAREIPRDALHGFFEKAFISVDPEKDSMLVNYCTEQVWDFRPYQDPHASAEERSASRRVLFGLLAMLDQPLDILRAIKDEISDLSIPLTTTTLTQLFPTWSGTQVSSFMRFQRDLHDRILENPNLQSMVANAGDQIPLRWEEEARITEARTDEPYRYQLIQNDNAVRMLTLSAGLPDDPLSGFLTE